MKLLKLMPILFIFFGNFPYKNLALAEVKNPKEYKVLTSKSKSLSIANVRYYLKQGDEFIKNGNFNKAKESYLNARKLEYIKSASFFTTLTDFEDPGDLSIFVSDEYLNTIKDQIDDLGFMDGDFLSQTFSFLRSNDLIYGPAVKSYLMGKKPPRFDLLYWNGDSTNLPGKMALEYLNKFYKENQLSRGELTLMGERLSLKYIDIPIFVVATHTDHIAPWRSSFYGLNKSSGNKRFVLAGSGHIAGIINPAYSKKYGYWTNSKPFSVPDDWFETADRHEGSWWPYWSSWIKARSSSHEKAYVPGSHKDYPSLGLAPGKYVMKNYK